MPVFARKSRKQRTGEGVRGRKERGRKESKEVESSSPLSPSPHCTARAAHGRKTTLVAKETAKGRKRQNERKEKQGKVNLITEARYGGNVSEH